MELNGRNVESWARVVAMQYPRSGIFDEHDLTQEAAIALMRGRKSISGPMQDYARKQGVVGDMRSGCLRTSLKEWKALHYPEQALNAGIDVRRLLSGLSARYRQALEMFYLYGMTEPEAAAALGIPLDRFRGRVREARWKLTGKS